MREIKFRAWDKTRRRFRFGDLDNLKLGLSGGMFWEFGNQPLEIVQKKEQANYVLMQFTGLKDKNGKEIYEGDIIQKVNEPKTKREIFFESGGFCTRDVCIHVICMGEQTLSEDVVIGNLYENPELLDPKEGGGKGKI